MKQTGLEHWRMAGFREIGAFRLLRTLGGVFLIAAATAAIGSCNSKPRPAAKVEAVSTAKVETVSAPLRVASAWSIDQSYAYRLKLVSRAEVGSAGNTFDVNLTADVELTPVSATGDEAELYLALRNPVLNAGAQGAKDKLQALLIEIQSPYFFTLEKGRLTQRRLKKELSVSAAGILDTVAMGLQVAPGPQGASTWSAQEYDTLGKYLAEYRSGSAPDTVIKRKVKYESTLVGGLSGSDFHMRVGFPEIIVSQGEIQTKNGLPVSVSLDDKIKMSMLSSAPLVSSTSLKLTLTGQTRSKASSSWVSLQAQTQLVSADAVYSNQKAVDRKSVV
jgi:hypothetical protein